MNKRVKRILHLIIFSAAGLFILGVISGGAAAQGIDRGIIHVEFLFSIESTGGRGERLRTPLDIYYDRKVNELYIADPGQRKIFIYDRSGMFLEDITIDTKEGSPTMVSVDDKGRIYVGHNRSPKISVFDYKGEPLEVIDLPGIVDVIGNRIRPMYFAAGPDGQVYVLKSRGGIVKIDPFGEKSEELRITGEDQPNAIYGMTIDDNGDFLFSDMRPYSIVRYNPKDRKFKRFGTPGILYGQIARPTGIATDKEGHIFVASLVRNKILCYDRDGNFIEEFGGIGKRYGRFYMPLRVASDGIDRLYVLEDALKRVQVFKITFNENKRG